MDYLALILVICIIIAYLIGSRHGRAAVWNTAYYKGRGDGWRSCENLMIDRMIKSDNMDLTKREILDEFIQ